MAPVSSHVQSVSGSVLLKQHHSFYSVYKKYIMPTGDMEIGTGSLLTGRMIPPELLESKDGQARIQSYLTRLRSAGFAPTIFQTTPAYYQSQGRYREGSTSATSAWRNSGWMIEGITQWAWNSSVANKRTVVQVLKDLTEAGQDLAPDSGSYTGEADPWTVDWRKSWWGETNYARLKQIKDKYDRRRLLSCWQ